MNQTIEAVLCLLRRAIYGQDIPLPPGTDICAVYEEMRQQSVAEIANNELMALCPNAELRRKWATDILSQLSQNEVILYEQHKLLRILEKANIPAVILKGAASAQYYPISENRAMGDVDVLVQYEQFERARCLLMQNGFRQSKPEQPGDCLISFEKNGIEFELHHRLRWDADVKLANALNDLVADGFDRIRKCHIGLYTVPVLPDMENGLVLLWHLRRHMDSGLGLRQILDWMLYVDRVLDDECWENGFEQAAKACGLAQLAIIATAMCQRHLGLTTKDRQWCSGADVETGDSLLQYIFDEGTFGCKQDADSKDAVISLIREPGIIGRINRMQREGTLRWQAAQKNRFLKRFAWMYQLVYYMRRSIERTAPVSSLLKDFKRSRKIRKMQIALGIEPSGRRMHE